jgi:hypothetical protein
VLLQEFCVARVEGESDVRFLAKVEFEAKNVVRSYSQAEQHACIKSMSNEGHLNRVWEKAGIAYAPRLQPGTDTSMKAARKRKACRQAGEGGSKEESYSAESGSAKGEIWR